MKLRINWDAIGVGTSVACAIHCALLPLFLTSLPLFGMNIIHNIYFEVGMIVMSFFIGARSFYHGYKKHHHSLLPVSVFIAGFAFLVTKQFFLSYEVWFLLPAVALIITAHLINFRSCRVHNHAHSDDCDH